MKQPVYFEPRDFDPQRIEWTDPQQGDAGVRIDPMYPDYVVRRRPIYELPPYDPVTQQRQYVLFPDLVQDAESACDTCSVAEVELLELGNHGITLPERSRYIIGEESDGYYAYMYVRQLQGITLDSPESPARIVLKYARTVLSYLGSKSVGEVFLEDIAQSRNDMYGRPVNTSYAAGGRRLYFFDLDPNVSVVTVTDPSPELPNAFEDEVPSYQESIRMVLTELEAIVPGNANQSEQRERLLAQSEYLLYNR